MRLFNNQNKTQRHSNRDNNNKDDIDNNGNRHTNDNNGSTFLYMHRIKTCTHNTQGLFGANRVNQGITGPKLGRAIRLARVCDVLRFQETHGSRADLAALRSKMPHYHWWGCFCLLEREVGS